MREKANGPNIPDEFGSLPGLGMRMLNVLRYFRGKKEWRKEALNRSTKNQIALTENFCRAALETPHIPGAFRGRNSESVAVTSSRKVSPGLAVVRSLKYSSISLAISSSKFQNFSEFGANLRFQHSEKYLDF